MKRISFPHGALRRRHRGLDRGHDRGLDRRGLDLDVAQLRAEMEPGEEGAEEGRVLVGYAAVWDALSEDLGWGVRERFQRGCFQHTDCRALWDHKSGTPLGRESKGTLELTDDDTGLRCRIDLPPTQAAADVYALVSRGDVSGMSVGFWSRKWEIEKVDDDDDIITVTEADLIEVSIVTFPAYPDTDIQPRHVREYRAAEETGRRDHQAWLDQAETTLQELRP